MGIRDKHNTLMEQIVYNVLTTYDVSETYGKCITFSIWIRKHKP